MGLLWIGNDAEPGWWAVLATWLQGAHCTVVDKVRAEAVLSIATVHSESTLGQQQEGAVVEANLN